MRFRMEITVADCDESMLRSRLAAMAYRRQIKRLKYIGENKFTCRMRGSPGLFKCAPTITIAGQFYRIPGARHVTVKYSIFPAYVHYLFLLVTIVVAISALKAVYPVPFLGGSGLFLLLDFFDYLQQKEHCQMKFERYIREG